MEVDINQVKLAKDDMKLRANLIQYDALKTEMHNRSDYQHRMVQVHFATIVLLAAGAFTAPYGIWLVFVIPVEASAVGLAWIDHALTIRRMGEFIQDRHERYIGSLLDDQSVMGWESDWRAYEQKRDPSRRLGGTFQNVHNWMFLIPALLALLAGWTYALGNLKILSDHVVVLREIGVATEGVLPSRPGLVGARIFIVWFAVLFGTYVTWRYWQRANYYWRDSAERDRLARNRPVPGDSAGEPSQGGDGSGGICKV
jgi:hypothetical protein